MSCRAKRRGFAGSGLFPSGTLGHAADAEDVDGDLLVLQKLDRFPKLGLVFIDERKCGVGRQESMVVNFSADISRVLAFNQEHVAIGTTFGLRRIVKGARPLT